ncbi:MAG: hypothetical protein K5753_04810 [Clostridia bacterium]|jgi:TrpR-related protein YerC/YecD|nr:hypothetical protein [Clostridia bacterium]
MTQEERKEELKRELCEVFAEIDNADDFARLLEDLCTYNEYEQLAQRLYAAKLFLQGGTYSKINEETSVSSATLSRISRCIRHGSGGYGEVLKKLIEK